MRRIVTAHVLLATAALLPIAARGAGPWSLHRNPRVLRADVDGRAETPAGTVPAVLRVRCKDRGGKTLCVSVKIEEAAQKIEGFDFAALEGRHAHRGEHLLRLQAGEASVEADPEGSWTHDPPGSFALSVCGKAGAESAAHLLAELVASGAAPVELTVRSPGGASSEIHAHFPADAEGAASRQVVERCAGR